MLFLLCPSLPCKALQHAQPCELGLPAAGPPARISPHAPYLPCFVCMQVVHVDKTYGDAPPKVPSLNVNYHR